MDKIKSINVLIVDDEPQAHDLLTDYINRTPILKLAGAASNGQMALKMGLNIQTDLLLLDIRMPKMSGFELLSAWPKPVPLVVITSAYREYALKGYEHAVVDFLEKPIFFDRFTEAVKRVSERFDLINRAQGQAALHIDLPEKNQSVLIVRSNRSEIIIPYESISHIEALENYLRIFTLNMPDKTVLTKMTVTECEQLLPSFRFIRISRKHIVHVEQIHQFTPTSIRLFTGESLPVGSKYKDSVLRALNSLKN